MDNLVDRIKFGESCYDPEAVEELAIASFGYIEEDVRNIKKGYISLGFHLNEMWQSCYYEELGYEDFYECVEKNFGLDKSAVSRCISVWKEFAAYDENSYSRKMWVDERYANYSYSQLAEMLPLKQEERRRVTPDMSVREIREFKKNLKNKKAKKSIENATEQKPVATSQPQEEKNADVKDYSCPPDVHSCVRKEWGASEEEQKRGHEECNKCWREYEKRKVIVAAAQCEEEKLSAYGTKLKVKDENALCFMPGCENDECFSCHLNCEVRQQECYCVEAPCGNPFPCTTLAVYENIKQEVGDACQFVNLELAEHRKGDGAAVPCCKNCNEPCGYQCNRASEWRYEKERREKQEHAEQKPVATSQQEETSVSQLELPDMKNMQEREDFVNSYKNWNIWCRNDLTEEVFYRFDLPDGAAIVVKNFPYYLEWKKEEREDREFYLLKPDYRHFANCKSSMTEIKEYLKNLRKKG